MSLRIWSTGSAEFTGLPLPGIELQAVDGRLQARAAQNLFRQTLQALLEIAGDIGDNVLVRNLLLFHQDQRIQIDTLPAETSSRPKRPPKPKKTEVKSTTAGGPRWPNIPPSSEIPVL